MAPITGVLQTRLSAIALCLLAASTSTTINSVNAQVLVPFSQNTDHHQLSARAENAVGTKLTSQLYNYVVKAAIGTPPQEVKLVINPSVGDTWVPDGTSYACRATSRYRYCDEDDEPYDPNEWADKSPTCIEGRTNTSGSCIWGSFLKSQSSTYLPANSRLSTFSVTTVEDLDVRGTNFTDKLTVGEIELDDYPMGLITSDDRNIGVLGLGRNSSYSYGDYVNFIDRLVRSGKIKSQAYSIWLDDPEGTSGNLLFGAVDKAKYEGDLIRVSARESNVFSRTFGISLTGINGTKGSGETMPAIRTNEFPVPVTVSPGELYSYLPDDIVDSVAAMVGASWNSRAQMMMIPCDAAKTNPVSFSFQILGSGGPVLKVETADLILPLEFRYSSSRVTSLPDGTCIFGIQQWDSSSSSSSSSSYSSYSTTYYNLGSALLKRTYMVFDLSNRQVALAPVKFSAGSSSDVVPFKTWGAYIPSAKSFDGSVLCDEGMENMSGRCYTSDGRRSGSGSGSSSGGYNDGFVDSESHWNRVALGVGIAFGILILISLVAAVVICTRRSKAKKDALKKQADLEGAPSVENVGGALPASGVAAASATRDVSGSPSPGASLSVIQEGKEEASQNAPQLPALSVTPLPAEEPKNVTSAVPAEPQVQTQPSTQVEEPKVEDVKGKGKEVDRSQ